MDILKSLLRKGYFPKELPPCFTTQSLAEVMSKSSFNSEDILKAPEPKSQKRLVKPEKGISFCIEHFLLNAGGDRRRLRTPHPVHYYSICNAIQNNWSDIDEHLGKSRISISKPALDKTEIRAFGPSSTGDARPEKRLHDRANGDTLLICDVSNFYESIYTHAIPWVFHTKEFAKKHRSNSYFGNLLDALVRNGQDQQTRGIPIGTDSSFVIAEAILTAVDIEVQEEHPNVIGFRFYDDFEFVCANRSEAENLLVTLENALRTYELQLNNRKTKIVSLPDEIDHHWIWGLRKCSFGKSMTKDSLIDFANISFRLSKQYPHDPVLRYALANILFRSKVEKTSNIWKLYQNVLCQFLRVEPQIVHLIAYELVRYSVQEYVIDENLLSQTIFDRIKKYSQMNATNELVWLLWIMIIFEIRCDTDIAKILTNVDDCLVALLTLDGIARGLIDQDVSVENWKQYMREDKIYSDKWLLVYEAALKEWLPIEDSSDYINQHSCFGNFHQLGVSFYDCDTNKLTKDLLGRLNPNADLYRILESEDVDNYGDDDNDDLPF